TATARDDRDVVLVAPSDGLRGLLGGGRESDGVGPSLEVPALGGGAQIRESGAGKHRVCADQGLQFALERIRCGRGHEPDPSRARYRCRGMGKVFEGIDERLQRWIAAQSMFFVGTAPLDPDGHVNVSPKGPIETLRVLGPSSVAYLDFVGSGAETVAHLRENGRIVIMLCAFSGPPRILRLHGEGAVVVAGEPGFDELLSSCGFDDV